jgi:hypothetical protein
MKTSSCLLRSREIAPAIGLAGLVAATILVIRKFSVLTGTSSGVVNALPWLIAAAAVGGVGYAHWLRVHRPAVYESLAQDRPAPGVPAEPAEGAVPDPTRQCPAITRSAGLRWRARGSAVR